MCAAMLSAATAHAVSPSGMAMDAQEQQVRDVVDDQAAAWNRHDPGAWAAPFAADAFYTNAFGATTRGRDAIEALQAGLFRDVLQDSSIAIVEFDARFADGVAIVQSRFVLQGNDLVTGHAPTNGIYRCLTVMRKDFLKWSIAAMQCGRQTA